MDNENKDLDTDNEEKNENSSNSDRFNVMPDEFFSFKYQQSRVRKEQQIRREKEEIDKRKRKQEEKIKRILEKEKIQKEKEEEKKIEMETREQERKKKEEERMIIEQRKQKEREAREAEKKRVREEREKIAKQKQDEARRILELRKRAIEEKKNYEKINKDQLKDEFERINQLKKEIDYTKLSKDELAEFNRRIEKEKKEALKKMKEQERLNKIEQKRILKEAKEEEKKKRKEAQELAKNSPIKIPNAEIHKKIDLSFIENIEERLKPKQTIGKKIFVTLFMIFAVVASFVISKLTFKDFGSLKEELFSNKNKDNTTANLPIAKVDYGYGDVTDTNLKISYGYGETENNSQNINIPINEVGYTYGYGDIKTEDIIKQEEITQQTDNKEFFRLFFSKNRFNMGEDGDNDYLTDKEEEYYNTNKNTNDSDGDLYIDGEEVSNLYDPNGFTPSKIINSSNVKIFYNNKISFYYPSQFKIEEKESGSLIVVIPGNGSEEYFEINIFNSDSNNFLDFIKQDLKNEDMNLLKLDIFNEAYIDSIGKNVYVKFNDDIIKIKYVNSLSVYNYSATFSMLIRSLMSR